MENIKSLYPYNSPFGLRYLVFVRRESYPDGSVRIQLYDSSDGTPYATATSIIQEILEPGEVAIKDWSENEGMLNFLVENRFVKPPHRYSDQGFVKVPICKLI
jgi:hypothetical protein